MKYFLLSVALSSASFIVAQNRPYFENGEAQIVPAFASSENWIREDLWVETDFDTDGDGRLDRMHVDVTRPIATNDGL